MDDAIEIGIIADLVRRDGEGSLSTCYSLALFTVQLEIINPKHAID